MTNRESGDLDVQSSFLTGSSVLLQVFYIINFLEKMYPNGCVICPTDIRAPPGAMWTPNRFHDTCVLGFSRKKHSFHISDLLHLQTNGIHHPLLSTQELRNSTSLSLCQQPPSALGPLKAFCTTKRVQSFVSSDGGVDRSDNAQRSRSNVGDKQLKFGISNILSDDFGKKSNEKENQHRNVTSPGVGFSSCSCGTSYNAYINTRVPFPSPSLSAVHALQPPTYPISPSVDSLPEILLQTMMGNQGDISPIISTTGPYSILNDDGNGCGQSKRKRSWSRAVFSNLQRKGLEKRFEVQKYVTKPDRRQLAAMLGLTDAQVKVWFQNRRMKWRHAQQQKEREREAKQSQHGEDLTTQEDVQDHEDIPDDPVHSPETSDDEGGQDDSALGNSITLEQHRFEET